MSSNALTVGQLARDCGVGVPTLRFYERRGLLPEPLRRVSGYRAYAPDAARRVRFIRQAQELGFSLSEIGELLALRMDDTASCADVRARAARKITMIETKLRSLARLHDVLTRLMASCPGDGPGEACPILGAMDDDHVADR